MKNLRITVIALLGFTVASCGAQKCAYICKLAPDSEMTRIMLAGHKYFRQNFSKSQILPFKEVEIGDKFCLEGINFKTCGGIYGEGTFEIEGGNGQEPCQAIEFRYTKGYLYEGRSNTTIFGKNHFVYIYIYINGVYRDKVRSEEPIGAGIVISDVDFNLARLESYKNSADPISDMLKSEIECITPIELKLRF